MSRRPECCPGSVHQEWHPGEPPRTGRELLMYWEGSYWVTEWMSGETDGHWRTVCGAVSGPWPIAAFWVELPRPPGG